MPLLVKLFNILVTFFVEIKRLFKEILKTDNVYDGVHVVQSTSTTIVLWWIIV